MLFLLGAVDTVAGIAQTGYDVAVLVQAVVLCAQIDVHIGVCFVQSFDALRCTQQTCAWAAAWWAQDLPASWWTSS